MDDQRARSPGTFRIVRPDLCWGPLGNILSNDGDGMADQLEDAKAALSDDFELLVDAAQSFCVGVDSRVSTMNDMTMPTRAAEAWCGRCVGDLLFPPGGSIQMDLRCRSVTEDEASGEDKACQRCRVPGEAPARAEEWALSASIMQQCKPLLEAVMRFPFHPERDEDDQKSWIDDMRMQLVQMCQERFVGPLMDGTVDLDPARAVPAPTYRPGGPNGDYTLASLARTYFLRAPIPETLYPFSQHARGRNAEVCYLRKPLMRWRQGLERRLDEFRPYTVQILAEQQRHRQLVLRSGWIKPF